MKIIRYTEILNEGKKRGEITNLVVKIGDKTFFNREASITFYEVIQYIAKNIGIDRFIQDNINSINGRKIIGLKPEDFPNYSKQGLKQSSIGKFIINTHSSTETKKSILTYLLENYNIEGSVEMRTRIEKTDNLEDIEKSLDGTQKYYLLGAYDGNLGTGQKSELWKEYVNGGYWLNGFAVAGVDKLKDEVNNIPVGAKVAIKSSYVRGKVNPVIMIKARGVVTKNYGDGTKIDVDWEKGFKPFEIQRNDVGGYRQTLHDISDKKEHIDLIWGNSNIILPPSEFIEKIEKPKVYEINPFGGKDDVEKPGSSAICVLGESGAGKSVTIENVLDFEGHIFEYIIPTAATTGLLAQFSPSKSTYVASRLGKMLILASNNPEKLYTAVFDEMHKSNVIEMINDELLQCISKRRNRGKRFISLDQDTAEIYNESDLKVDRSGNILIPDNFGFIFISSKPRVIANNADFFNRVDIIILTSADREIKTSDELLSKVLPEEEKMKLASSRND